MPKNEISPSVHEGMIIRHFGRDPITRESIPDGVLVDMHDALQGARLAAEKSARIADAILANEMMTLPMRHKRIRDEAWKIIEPALRRHDAARTKALNEV